MRYLSVALLCPLVLRSIIYAQTGAPAEPEIKIDSIVTRNITQNPKAKIPVNIETTGKLTNTTATDKNVVLCLTGVTVDFDQKFIRTEVDMTVAGGKITCNIPGNYLPSSPRRLGAMGCQLFPVKANATVSFSFTSGNDRVIPLVTDGKIVPGKFVTEKGMYGGTGPQQNGKFGGIAFFGGGIVGGHPPAFTVHDVGGGRIPLLDALGDLYVQLVSLDAQTGFDDAFDTDRTKSPFNCNRCFGMDKGSTTGGYFLNTIPAQEASMSAFESGWVKYRDVPLTAGQASKARVMLYTADTYFRKADAPALPAKLDISVTGLPAACKYTIDPAAGAAFTISPREEKIGELAISCDNTLAGMHKALFVTTILGTDVNPARVITKHAIRAMTPAGKCDVNADGSVDELDLAELQEMAGASAPAGSRYDINGDGLVDGEDVQACAAACSRAFCAVP